MDRDNVLRYRVNMSTVNMVWAYKEMILMENSEELTRRKETNENSGMELNRINHLCEMECMIYQYNVKCV